jgi:hypothetical protein
MMLTAANKERKMMIGLSSAKFDIFLPIAYPRWPPQGNLVYHWNLWEFH